MAKINLKIFRDKVQSSLTFKMIFYILLFSALFTILTSAIQLFQDYREDVGLIHKRMELIQKSYLGSLSASVWEVDKEHITTQLKGILSLSDIQYVNLSEPTKELSFSMGKKSTENIISQRFPLKYSLPGSEVVSLGTLSVIATLENVHQRILNKVLLILVTQMVKTFCVSFCIFFIIHSLITRHLITISQYASSLKLNSLDNPLILNRKLSENDQQDELDQVVNASNEMRLGLRQEIADREHIEKELRNSRNMFIAIFEQAAVGVALVDIRKGNFIRVNKKYCDIVGYSHEEMKATTFMELTHPDDLQTDLDNVKQLWEGKIDSFSMEKRLFHKNGSIVWVNLSVSPMLDKGGSSDYHIAVVEDITKRKLVEEKLRDSIIDLNQSVKAGHVGLWNWNLITNKVTFSAEWKRQIGYEEHEIKNDFSEWEERVHPDDLKPTLELIEKSIKDVNQSHHSEFRFRHRDGSYLWIFSQASFIQNKEGQPIRMVGAHLDITKQKKAEAEKHKLALRIEQSQRMEAIGTLAGGIAHDFNNILSPLIGFAEMLQEDLPQESPHQESVDEVLQAALRAKELVKQILAFSRQQEKELKPVKVQSILKEALKLLGPSLPATIDIQTDINPDCGVVLADATQIHQVIMNLATNAYHAMQKAGGQLIISLNQTQIESNPIGFTELIPGKYALLKVIDTGTGIQKNVINKIFDPYFTTKAQDKGTGLGLSVVQGIVKSCNGDIHIYSEPDKGTEVHVYLPIMKKTSDHAMPEPLEPIQRGVERILLVDDEEQIMRMEKMMLERLGYHVTSQTNSIEALKVFKANPHQFDLIISDMTMPNMTGVQLANAIKVLGFDIPIIICTGFSDLINAENYKEIGIQGYVVKPVIKRDMARTIREVLDTSNKTKTV